MSFFGCIKKIFGGPIRGLWRVSFEGVENIPETGCILVCNHTSFSDVLVLEATSTRQVFFMGKAELFKIPLLKQLITALGAFPVNRGGADITSIKRTISEIHSGKVVGIFPQGTRHPGVDPRGTDVIKLPFANSWACLLHTLRKEICSHLGSGTEVISLNELFYLFF